MALQELQSWEERRLKLNHQVNNNTSTSEKVARLSDLKKVNDQIDYYDALTKDMKKDYRPSTLLEFLHSLSAHYYLLIFHKF